MVTPNHHKQTEVYAGLKVRQQLASLKKRALATVVDFCLLTVLIYAYVLVVILVALFGVIGVDRIDWLIKDLEVGGVMGVGFIIFAVIALLGLFAIFHGYFIRSEFRTGQTPGKKIFGLRVQDMNGRPLSFRQAVMRDLLRYVDFGLYLIPIPGLIVANSSERKQRLGDLAAGTIVTHSASEENKKNFLYLQPESYFRIYEQVIPQQITLENAKEVLSIAFPTFILRTRAVNDVEQEFLIKALDYYLPSAERVGLSRRDQVVFLFEMCNQRTLMAA